MRPNVDTAMQRTRQYWYEDGLTEIVTGLVFAAIGLMFLSEAWGVVPAGVSSIGLILIVGGGMVLGKKAVGYAKARITYPRTGFVRYPRKPRRSEKLAVGIAGFMGALVSALFMTAPASLDWLPAIDGVLVGGCLLYLGYTMGLGRFYLLAAVSAAVGVGLSMAGTGDILGTGLYFVAMGVVVLISGGLTLAGYLRGARSEDEE